MEKFAKIAYMREPDESEPPVLVLPDPRERPTLTIRQTAALLGVSLHCAYDAAHRGEIPVIWIGRRMLVPTAALLTMVGLSANPSTGRSEAG